MKSVLLYPKQVNTRAVNKAGPNRSEDNAGDEDKSSNQQEGNKIEHHQKSKEQKVRLDTTSEVPCRHRVPMLGSKCKYRFKPRVKYIYV